MADDLRDADREDGRHRSRTGGLPTWIATGASIPLFPRDPVVDPVTARKDLGVEAGTVDAPGDQASGTFGHTFPAPGSYRHA
jgi:hypothetical protein